MSSLRSLLSAGALIFAGAFVFQACGKQSEGMRCETANGNNDCDPGLECVQRECCSEKICCPKVGSESTEECRGAATAPSDAATSETTVTDTGAADTTTDASGDTAAPADTATDTATDAAADAADAGG